jgi:hypothetical protein
MNRQAEVKALDMINLIAARSKNPVNRELAREVVDWLGEADLAMREPDLADVSDAALDLLESVLCAAGWQQ